MEKAILEQVAAGGGSFLDGIAMARWLFPRAASTGGTTEMSQARGADGPPKVASPAS